MCPANTGASDFAVATETESALRAQLDDFAEKLDDAEDDIPTWGIAIIAVVASVLVVAADEAANTAGAVPNGAANGSARLQHNPTCPRRN